MLKNVAWHDDISMIENIWRGTKLQKYVQTTQSQVWDSKLFIPGIFKTKPESKAQRSFKTLANKLNTFNVQENPVTVVNDCMALWEEQGNKCISWFEIKKYINQFTNVILQTYENKAFHGISAMFLLSDDGQIYAMDGLDCGQWSTKVNNEFGDASYKLWDRTQTICNEFRRRKWTGMYATSGMYAHYAFTNVLA